MVRCSAITNKGRRCKLHRVEGSNVCAMHVQKQTQEQEQEQESVVEFETQAATAPALVISDAENTIGEPTFVDISGNTFTSDLSDACVTAPCVTAPCVTAPCVSQEPPSQKYLLKLKKVAQERWAATNTEKLCGHLCKDTKNIQCCACSDKRPHDAKYNRTIQGLGEVSWLREDTYCEPCRKKYKTETLPHVAQYNLVMDNTEFNGPALGNYGFQVCKDIEDSIQGLLTMHNTLYERCISLALISRIDTLDTQQETVLHP